MSRGGKRDNAGRPSLPDKQKLRAIRLSDRLWAIYKNAGGTKYLRKQLELIERGG